MAKLENAAAREEWGQTRKRIEVLELKPIQIKVNVPRQTERTCVEKQQITLNRSRKKEYERMPERSARN